LAGRVHHQGFGQRGGIFAQVEAFRVEPPEGVVGRGGHAGDAEGVEDMNRAEPLARLARDLRILALGVDHQHRAFGQQEVRDHRANAFARAGGGEGQQMRRAVIAQQLAGIEVAPDQKAVTYLQKPRVPSGWQSAPSRGCPPDCGPRA
jgi:hypothetical protein